MSEGSTDDDTTFEDRPQEARSLLPCPFCNAAPARAGVHDGPRVKFNRITLDRLVVCPFCEASGPTAGTIHEAIDLWNGRPLREPNSQEDRTRAGDDQL